jgi:hypothetical protein
MISSLFAESGPANSGGRFTLLKCFTTSNCGSGFVTLLHASIHYFHCIVLNGIVEHIVTVINLSDRGNVHDETALTIQGFFCYGYHYWCGFFSCTLSCKALLLIF